MEGKVSPPRPPKKTKGLTKKRTPVEKAATGVKKRLNTTHESKTPEILPFESTLAYVFRGSGGKTTAVNAARLVMHTDERFKRLVYAFDTASPTDQSALRLEDALEACEILPDEFLKTIIPALWTRNVDISKVMAAIAQPQLTEAAIKNATTGGSFGFQDRQALLQAGGLFPAKPGMSINVDASHKTLVQSNSGTVELHEGPKLPAFHEDIEFISVSSQRPQRQLEAAAKLLPPPILEAEIVQPGD